MFFEHRDGTVATVLEHCGSFYHRWMPKDLWYPPKDTSAEDLAEWYARRLPWRYDVAESFDDGSKKMKCPFHAGKLYNSTLAGSPKRRGSAQFTAVPKGATRCCNGTFIAKPYQLANFQTPTFGTAAHNQVVAYRNPSEGINGVLRNRGGLDHRACRAKGDEAHSLAALLPVVVHNLQITLNIELERRRQRERRREQLAKRRADQDPHDGRPAANTGSQPPTGPTTSPAPDTEPDPDTAPDADSRDRARPPP